MKTPPRLMMVHWIDAFDSPNGWVDVEDYSPKPCHVYQVGYVIDDLLEHHLSLTGSWCPEPEGEITTIGMVSHIPLGMVVKVQELGVPEWGRSTPETGEPDAT